MTDYTSLLDLLISQSSNFMPLHLNIIIALVRLRYFLGGDRPSQTISNKLSQKI